MENLFELINVSESKEVRVMVGIRINIAGQESICPVSRVYNTQEELAEALGRFISDLEKLSLKARNIFKGVQDNHNPVLSPDMPPEEIWQVLSETANEDLFIELFNQLDEEKRKEVAEYVLTQCNVFTGRGAGFSSRYNNETTLLEDE